MFPVYRFYKESQVKKKCNKERKGEADDVTIMMQGG
jgi:hypothetical protein